MMDIKTALPVKTAGLVIGLLATSVAWADPVRTEWSSVEQISPGRKVEVKLYTDEPFKGALSVKGRLDSQGVTARSRPGANRSVDGGADSVWAGIKRLAISSSRSA